MPRGRLLDVDQASEWADRGIGNEPLYLRGDFMVTAARENPVVLRPRQSLANRVLNGGNARIIGEYPRGLPTPREGESFQRVWNGLSKSSILERARSGELDVYVREVTTAE